MTLIILCNIKLTFTYTEVKKVKTWYIKTNEINNFLLKPS